MSKANKTTSYSLEKLQAGDRAEFALIVDEYSGLIYRLGLKMLDNPQDAEDVLQETFIKAYKALPRFDGRSSISTWLYRIATNEALMVIRKRKGVEISIEDPAGDNQPLEEPMQIKDWCCLPESELMSVEAKEYLKLAVDKLPEKLRVVFVLRDLEGLTTRETAQVLNLTETAVKTRLSRARLKLRELLTEYYGERVNEQEKIREDDYEPEA